MASSKSTAVRFNAKTCLNPAQANAKEAALLTNPANLAPGKCYVQAPMQMQWSPTLSNNSTASWHSAFCSLVLLVSWMDKMSLLPHLLGSYTLSWRATTARVGHGA